MKLYIVLFLSLVLLPAVHLAQEDISDLTDVQIKVQHVSGSVYMLEASGDVAGNMAACIGDDGILLVDTQFAPLAGKIRKALAGVCTGPIRYIINTHHHPDHTHGNEKLGSNAVIISQNRTRQRLQAVGSNRLPGITFTKELCFRFNSEDIRILAFPPGHTDNDIVVFFQTSGVAHLGDLWNSGISSFPTVDLEAGGSIAGMLVNVTKLLEIIPEKTKLIPGHYGCSDPTGLRKTQEMLQDTITLVKRKKKAGFSLNKILTDGLPDKYSTWGTAYADAKTWIENIFDGIK